MAELSFKTTLCVFFVYMSISMAQEDVYFGTAIIVKAFDSICWYENLMGAGLECTGNAQFVLDGINSQVTKDYVKEHPEFFIDNFGNFFEGGALANLPAGYQSNCKAFLHDASAEPKANESDVLNDGGKQYPFRAFATCLIKTLRETHGNESIEATRNPKDAEAKIYDLQNFGMGMAARAYDIICWYETLKLMPTHSDKYADCAIKADFQLEQIRNTDFYKQNRQIWQKSYGDAMTRVGMEGLPESYQQGCTQYLNDPKAEPPADESDSLNDGQNGKKYPFQAFAYCLMKILRDTRGSVAVDAVKNEKTHAQKDYMQIFLDRHNEFRALHGVGPLQLKQELIDSAQAYAELQAKTCEDSHHGSFGENMLAGNAGDGSMSEKGDSAYASTDVWYEEIKSYTFQDEYPGGIPESLDSAHPFGHFTQVVWKNSKYVGFGMADNLECGKTKPAKYTRYIVARYDPVGNVGGEFPQNVLPLKTTS